MVNTFAGMGAHQSARSKTVEWLTPPHILRALGPFDLDPCSPINRPWDTADRHLTIEDNGLIEAWHGRVWLNPPYSRRVIRRWMARMAEHAHGTALIFARTETLHFNHSVWPCATALLFLFGRINFHYVDGVQAKANAGAPTVLIAYGQEDADRLLDSGITGKFVPLQMPRLFAVALASEPSTWAEIIADIMRGRGPVHLDVLYRAVADHPKTRDNAHWRAKVRQILQQGSFDRRGNGIWEDARLS